MQLVDKRPSSKGSKNSFHNSENMVNLQIIYSLVHHYFKEGKVKSVNSLSLNWRPRTFSRFILQVGPQERKGPNHRERDPNREIQTLAWCKRYWNWVQVAKKVDWNKRAFRKSGNFREENFEFEQILGT